MDLEIPTITQERAAARFHQVATLERQIAVASGAIADCQAHLKELRQSHEMLLLRLRRAARDEGELPLLFDLEAE